MSSTTAGSSNSPRYLDFDEYVDLKLQKTRSTIKSTDILVALAGVATMFLGYLLAFVAFDQWVIPGGFSIGWRWTLLSMLLIMTSAWLIWRVGIPYLRTVNRLYAAQEIEKADPELKSNLLNLVDLRSSGRDVDPAIMKALEKNAAVGLQNVDVAQAVDHRPLMRMAYALLAVVVMFCLYALLSPKKISNSIWRSLIPATELAVSTQTEIIAVQPGDITILAREKVAVSADIAGEVPEKVWLHFTTADGKFRDEPVELRTDGEGPTRFKGFLLGENGQGLLQDLTYVVKAGDAVSREYRITVNQPPSATVDRIQIQFPAYMKLDTTDVAGGQIDSWEGTKVTLTAHTNLPVKTARIEFLDTPDSAPKGEEATLSVSSDGQQLTASWTLGFRTDGSYAKAYQIQVKTESGATDPRPTVYGINIRPDLPPEISLLEPVRDMEAPANAVIPLLIEARDPDFELSHINLHIRKNGQPIHKEPLSDGRQQRLVLKHDLKLERFLLKPGDQVEFWVQAFDNKQARPNSKVTPELKLKIVDKVSDDKVQQQLAEDKANREQRLKELQQEQNPDVRPDQPPAGDPMEERRNPQDPMPMPQKPEGAARDDGNSPDGGKPDRTRGNSDPQNPSDAGPAKDQPLKPDGDDDEKALQRIIDELNKKKNKDPQDPSRQDDGSSEDKTAQPGANDSDSTGKPKPGTNGDDSAKPKPASGQNSPKDSTEGSRPDPTKPDQPPKSNGTASDPSKPPMPNETGGNPPKGPKPPKNDGSGNDPSENMPMPGTENGSGDSEKPMPRPGETNSTKDKSKPGEGTAKPGTDPAGAKPDPTQKPKTDNPAGVKPMPGEEGKDPSPGPKPDPKQGPGGTADKPKTDGSKPDGNMPDGNKPDGNMPNGDKPEGDNATGAKPDGAKPDGKKPPMASPDNSGTGTPSESPSPTKPMENKKPDANGGAEGPQEPAKSSPDAVRKPADGTEKGIGEPDKDPTAKPTPSNNPDVQRDPKTKPETRPGESKSEGPKKPGDPAGSEKPMPKPGPGDDGNPPKKPETPGGAQPNNPNDPANAPSDNEVKNPKPKRDANNPEKLDQPKPEEDGSKPGKNPDQRPGDPNAAKEKLQGEGEKNQRSKEPSGGGQTGSSKEDDMGKPGSQNSGEGDATNRPGEQQPSNKDADPKGRGSKKEGPGSKPGEGEGNKPGGDKPGTKPGSKKEQGGGEGAQEGAEQQGGEKGEGGEGPAKPGAKPGQAGKPGQGGADGQKGNGMPGGGGQGGQQNPGPAGNGPASVADGEEANLEFKKQATELVLKRLQDGLERGDIDPELLEKLGWTEDEMRRFTERLNKYLQEAKPGEETPESTARRQQFEEMLKGLDVDKKGTTRKGDGAPSREVNQIETRRGTVPKEYRSAYDKFTREVNRQKSKPAPASK